MDRFLNPFALRTTENIDSDELFLKLFAVEPIRKLQEQCDADKLWQFVTFIQSPPGFGKTSLLRVFSPSVLKKIESRNQDVRDVHDAMRRLGVKEGKLIKKCAVYLLTRSDYALLDDEELYSKAEQNSLFLGLLNVRFAIATIKTLMILSGVAFDDIDKIQYCPPKVDVISAGLDFPKGQCNCKDLFRWAATKETAIYKAINSFERDGADVLACNSLFVLPLIQAHYFSYMGKPLCEEFIFQLDDAHKLTYSQRKTLEKVVIATRLNVTLWIAERLDNLIPNELLETDRQERDFQVVELDKYNDNSHGFDRMVKLIASRRSAYSVVGIDLMTMLSNSDTEVWDKEYRSGAIRYLQQIKRSQEINSYQNLVDAVEAMDDLKDRAYYARALLMYVNRQSEKVDTMRLFPYERDELTILLSDTLKLAEEIVPVELKIPKYYGEKSLINVSNVNVEQFLDFSAAIYSRMSAKKITSPLDYALTAKEQDEVIRERAKEFFSRVHKMPHGDEMRHFLEGVISFCKKETLTDSYSYRTVSGFSINDCYGNRNHDCANRWYKDNNNGHLREILRTCIAYNLLTIRLEEQGKKGQVWPVFYLNRALCVCAGIPLNYGGWRKLKIDQIKGWL